MIKVIYMRENEENVIEVEGTGMEIVEGIAEIIVRMLETFPQIEVREFFFLLYQRIIEKIKGGVKENAVN